MTSPDLFWQLFRSSGHVGAYLLYAWSDHTPDRAAAEYEAETADVGSPAGPGGDDEYLEPSSHGR